MTAATLTWSRRTPPLDAVLAGEVGANALGELAIDTSSSGVEEQLAVCLPAGQSGSLRLTRTKYKPDRKLAAWYELRAPDEAARGVACTWWASPPAGRSTPAAGRAISRDGRIEVQVSPADHTMPVLAELSDPHAVGSRLAARGAGTCDTTTVEIVRYRPGQRHVLRVRRCTEHRDVFVKIGRDGGGARSLQVRRTWAPVLARSGTGVSLVEPAGDASLDGATFWYAAPGDTLRGRLRDAPGSAPALLVRLGAALRALHDLAPADLRLAADGETPDEVAATARASEHIERLLPAVGASVRHTLQRVVALLDQGAAPAPTAVHGDLKADNLIVDGPRITLLDLDRWRVGDPAVDLGKLVADLRWWMGPDTALLEAGFAEGYGTTEPVRWQRAAVLAALFRLRFAARRCQLHDPAWADQVAWHVSTAADELARVPR